VSPLSAEEEERLKELEKDLAAPVGPPPEGPVRADRFSDTALGMDDEGELFPAPPLDEAGEKPAPR
jgi:hypothetical protein